ncbi:MAG: ribonuclease D [Hyphomicrobiales bacterium]|nr:ribonuclease D [Hyphomicrobiales bacterium]
MGLNPHRDRLCLVQISAGDDICHMVQFPLENGQVRYEAPNLGRLLTNTAVTKIFHFGRFDIAMLYRHLGVVCEPVYCTKIASKLVRTYTDRHGLKDLCRDLLSIELSKEQQTTDWGAATLSPEQLNYAARDVLYLHRLRSCLNGLLEREDRTELAQACFEFLPARAKLDVAGWNEIDIFAH